MSVTGSHREIISRRAGTKKRAGWDSLPAPIRARCGSARRTRAKSHNGVQESRSKRRGVKRGVERVSTVARALHTRPCRQMPIWEPSPNARRCFGRSRTWESAFDTFYVDLCEYVLRLVGSADAAEDLVQDLFLHLWNTRGPRDELRLTRAYLYVAARNRALKSLRHRHVVTAWIERARREEPPAADTPEDLYCRRELRAAVDDAIAALPERCREIFLLRRRDQLSYHEIAARTGVSLRTVKSQMWRATVRLQESLAFILPAASPTVPGVRHPSGATIATHVTGRHARPAERRLAAAPAARLRRA